MTLKIEGLEIVLISCIMYFYNEWKARLIGVGSQLVQLHWKYVLVKKQKTLKDIFVMCPALPFCQVIFSSSSSGFFLNHIQVRPLDTYTPYLLKLFRLPDQAESPYCPTNVDSQLTKETILMRNSLCQSIFFVKKKKKKSF